jgi:predicted heme/steroid binding protein
MAPPAKTFTREEVRNHTSEDSLWCIIDHTVYDLTDFVDAHPGGESVLRQIAGQDATSAFYNLHRHEVLSRYADLAIGTVEGEAPEVITPQPGDLSPVPYAEPLWLTPHFKSPYFNDSHRSLRKAIRIFTDEVVKPEALECEATGRHVSQEVIDKMSQSGVIHMRLGPGKHLHGVNLLNGAVKGEEFDYFHDMVMCQEMTRPMMRGFQDGNLAGMAIGLTAVLNFARDGPWKKKIVDDVFSGKKKLCLAITEAFAGSDVAGLRTTAEKTPDGKHYVSSSLLRKFTPFTNIPGRSSTEPRSGSPTASSATTSSSASAPARPSA